MQRRHFHFSLAAAAAAITLPACAQLPERRSTGPSWSALETRSGGRMGIAILHADGRLEGHRLDERFPICSTFKWLAGAAVLRRVDLGLERLDRRIAYGREVLQPHSPITEQHVGRGMTLGELCHATITTSDNAAGNLVLQSLGGPQALTAYARSLGDEHTRLDRWETALNEATPRRPARHHHAARHGGPAASHAGRQSPHPRQPRRARWLDGGHPHQPPAPARGPARRLAHGQQDRQRRPRHHQRRRHLLATHGRAGGGGGVHHGHQGE